METRDHLKNRENPKSLISRGIMLFFSMICLSSVLFGQSSNVYSVLSDNVEYDFGEISTGKEHIATLSFKNDSKEIKLIAKTKTSCPCLTAFNYSKAPIRVGEIGEVEIKYRPQGPGARNYTITIFWDWDGEVTTTVKVRAVAKEPSQYSMYDNRISFSNGFAIVKKDNKYGFINEANNLVIPLKYEDTNSFNEKNYAWVKLNGKWGLIDQTGKTVILHNYDEIDNGYGGTYVKLNGKWGFVDKTTLKEIVSCKYDKIITSEQGGIFVKSNEKWGFIDKKTSKEIIPCKYDDIEICYNSMWLKPIAYDLFRSPSKASKQIPYAFVELNKKWGCINTETGKEIFTCEYVSVWKDYETGYARLYSGSEEAFFNYNTGQIESAEYWHRKAAKEGSTLSQYKLALIYINDKKDGDTALYWLEKAVKNEDGSLEEEEIIDVKNAMNILKEKGFSSSRAKLN